MKSVLISIQPKWCELIASGKKTVEVRKTKPKIETPFKCYIYCTKEKRKDDFITISGAFGLIRCPECAIYNRAKEYDCNGKVIGEFVCDGIEPFTEYELLYDGHYVEKKTRVPQKELFSYKGKNDFLYGWHISQLKIYDKPKELYDFANYEKYQVCKEKDCFSGDCWVCPNNPILIRPPQSWSYVEPLKEN